MCCFPVTLKRRISGRAWLIGLPLLPSSPRRKIRFQVAGEGESLLAMAAQDSQVAERHITFSTHETGADLGRGGSYGRCT
jgi:hypothetical protein